MIKIAVDAMGGDFAPDSIIKGSLKALSEEKDLYLYLYGDEPQIQKFLKKHISSELPESLQERLSIIHTPHYLDMGVKNIREEIRDNSQHSMFLALQAAKNKEVDGVVSAGPTQALILASYLIIGTIQPMKRIALAIIFPSLDGRTRILLDAGANIEIKAENLLLFAIAASIVAQELFNIETPIVKMLNIGSEPHKGRNLEMETFDLLEKTPHVLFKGNEEPQNILYSEADVLLSDGFTSNMIVKTYKGAFGILMKNVKNVLTENWFKKIISKLLFQKKLQNIKKKLDSKEIGGAMILGLNKIVVKAQGNSDYYSFYNAILKAKKLIEKDFLTKLSQKIKN
ncbi:phosphate acyltransferase PlsX [Candidatus Phytoplasma pruni]|uniref:Phosphate acyltransferase n=1 Tax=Candidatus Phytoplasma pruni TaxID=479893 RepID=A0A851HJ85_9MOLU|nr:phosphate acyltransferase PlsX [Candidatus Phytoplasma pruni]NWN45606.1 phosphate acyltransferase PlsX [Candidatus Phytoplasma pruni]